MIHANGRKKPNSTRPAFSAAASRPVGACIALRSAVQLIDVAPAGFGAATKTANVQKGDTVAVFGVVCELTSLPSLPR